MARDSGHEPVAIGVIGRARGLAGQCRVFGIGKTLAESAAPLQVLVGAAGRDLRPMVITEIRDANQGFVCRFEGVEDRTGAEKLRNLVLHIPQESLPPLEDGAYYHFQLEGLSVESTKGELLGRVVRVHNYPTVDALEVAGDDGGSIVVPIRDEVVERIDCDAGRVIVHKDALEELL